MVSTDPPYYDNIGYADLSDFFYVWLRRTLKPIFPDLFATLAVPKTEELVATPYRHGGKPEAEEFFLKGMSEAMNRISEHAHPAVPVTIYYAFKQSETKASSGISSTGWETFLDALIRSGFAITGTWPMRTELDRRMIGMGTNALASSIVLVCRRRPTDASPATRREFLTALRTELPQALRLLQTGNIAPVDLAQAAIGPGMAVYTRYAPFGRRSVGEGPILRTSVLASRPRAAVSLLRADEGCRLDRRLCHIGLSLAAGRMASGLRQRAFLTRVVTRRLAPLVPGRRRLGTGSGENRCRGCTRVRQPPS